MRVWIAIPALALSAWNCTASRGRQECLTPEAVAASPAVVAVAVVVAAMESRA
ncbi:MAG TPA: hypothetical protein VKC61_24045 [Pyrinomonadaceae bacterium]|nr:hypothetical protein [Pyrinomonadaceae bacterium]